jgi:hypothetical protein
MRSCIDTQLTLTDELFADLKEFIHTDPKIPGRNKSFTKALMPDISVNDTREQINEKIIGMADKSETAMLTLYVYRQMDMIDWHPFVKASIERNPVCFSGLKGKTTEEVYNLLKLMPDESIYDDKRLALPDEVWNFQRGDGIEKALLLADFIMQNDGKKRVSIKIDHEKVIMESDDIYYVFNSTKQLKKSILISGDRYTIS